MKALLFADRPGRSLAPLTDNTCVALLPVAAKPLVVYSIEDLTIAGFHEVVIAVGPHADLVEQELGDGQRWGLRISYVLKRPDESAADVIRKSLGQLGDRFLMLRGDLLRAPLDAELRSRLESGDNSLDITQNGTNHSVAGVASAADPSSWILSEENAAPAGNSIVAAETLDIRNPIASLADYHRANLDAASGKLGVQFQIGREIVAGVRAGRQSRVPASAIKGTPLLVGSRCQIDSSAELLGDVVVSDDVIIDRHATLKSTVVLPNTYIGEMVDVSDSIVATNYLINPHTGVVTRVVDTFLLSSLSPDSSTRNHNSFFQRILGLVVLAASLPLWPLAMFASLLANPRHPMRRVELIGNRFQPGMSGGHTRQPFTTAEFATEIPVLKWLPLILRVITGEIRMVGVEALTPTQDARLGTEWERMRNKAPTGLIGPVLLTMGSQAPDEEKRVVEAFYARTRTPGGDLTWMLRSIQTLFSARAWLPRRPTSPIKLSMNRR